jgi:16S rRNA (cytosine1402-N4)-methyltransferase
MRPSAPALDSTTHIPVLLREAIDYLDPQPGKTYIDATFGRGGYSRAILEAEPTCLVIAMDRDPDAASAAQDLQNAYPDRFSFASGRFSQMAALCNPLITSEIGGVVFDVGVSSPQIDESARGFSFAKDGPLDMRMDKTGPSAADVVNTYGEEEIANIIYEFGEERASRRIAHKICEVRKLQPITTTKELAGIIRSIVRPSADELDPSTRTFQALRIYVNNELGELQEGLEAAHQLLSKGGRLVVVAFHSLEDRIAKQFFKRHSESAVPTSRYLPQPVLKQPTLKILTRKTVTAQDDEVKSNPRARSARLRAAEKVV